MSDITYRECETHGAHSGTTCPVCDETAHKQPKRKPTAHCKPCNVIWYQEDYDACPECKGAKAKTAPKTKQKQVLVVERPPEPRLPQGMLSFQKYKALSPNKVSREEYERYRYLFALESDGIIRNLELQIAYELLPAVEVPGINWYTKKLDSRGTREGFKQGAMSYSPDFQYQVGNVKIIEEYKAIKKTKAQNHVPLFTGGYRNKLKWWVAKYADRIVSGEWFFCIVGWNKFLDEYTAFDSNSNIIDYPYANYMPLLAETPQLKRTG